MKTWTCQRDGACCRNNVVVLTVSEWRRLEGMTPLRVIQLDQTRADDGLIAMNARPCPFLNLRTNACTVYDVRPYNCRRFQCGRWDTTKEPYTEHPLPLISRDNDLYWSYKQNQRLHQPWAREHGWPDDASAD